MLSLLVERSLSCHWANKSSPVHHTYTSYKVNTMKLLSTTDRERIGAAKRLVAIFCGLVLVAGVTACDLVPPTVTPEPSIPAPSSHTPTLSPTPSPSIPAGIEFTGIEVLSEQGASDELIEEIKQRISDFYLNQEPPNEKKVTKISFGKDARHVPGDSCSGRGELFDDNYIAPIFLNNEIEQELRVEIISDGKSQRLTQLFSLGEEGELFFPVFVGGEILSQYGWSGDLFEDVTMTLAGYHQVQAWCGDEDIVSEFSFGTDMSRENIGEPDGDDVWYRYTVSLTLDGRMKTFYLETMVYIDYDDEQAEAWFEIGYLNPDGSKTLIDSRGD